MAFTMKAKVFIAILFLVLASSLHAEDHLLKPVVASTTKADTSWNTNSWLWKDLVYGYNPTAGVQIGKSGITVSGPLVETLPHGKTTPDRSLGQKILAFPLVHLFVPQPMPPAGSPPGKYFAWRDERSQSWAVMAGGGAAPGPGFIRFGW